MGQRAQVEVFLQCLTDSVQSEGFPFTYLPRDTGTDREQPPGTAGITARIMGMGTRNSRDSGDGIAGIEVEVFLQRLTDSVRSEGFPFTYLPRDTGNNPRDHGNGHPE